MTAPLREIAIRVLAVIALLLFLIEAAAETLGDWTADAVDYLKEKRKC